MGLWDRNGSRVVSAHVEVVTPGGDLVAGDFEGAHPGCVEGLAVDGDAVDSLGQHDVAGDREVDDLDVATCHALEEALDGSTHFVVSGRRREGEPGEPRCVGG